MTGYYVVRCRSCGIWTTFPGIVVDSPELRAVAAQTFQASFVLCSALEVLYYHAGNLMPADEARWETYRYCGLLDGSLGALARS